MPVFTSPDIPTVQPLTSHPASQPPAEGVDAKERVARSMQLYHRAGEIIPGWTQLISRRADQFANGISPVYAQRAKGSRFIDVDETVYIDWVNAVGAVILGHADDVVDNAVKAQIDRGSIYTLNSPLEIELAEELVATIPSAEMVRYTKGGGEACAVAARIARGVTGRELILICGYHGWHDWYQAANYLADPDSGEFPFAGIEPIGVPRSLASTILPFRYGDLKELSQLFAIHSGEIAGIMMEPARSELPPPGYLEGVQALARQHGAVLIFDEVSSGWRLAVGGIQEHVGVTPDMTVVAKAMSNGYPMGAVVGSQAVMEAARHMFISSSYWSDNIGLVAALTTIRELKRRDSVRQFKAFGEALRSALNQAIADAGLHGSWTGLHTNPKLSLILPDPLLDAQVNTLFVQEMARRGIHCLTSLRSTLAHGEDDIRQTALAATEALTVVKRGLDSGDLDKYLLCDTKKEPFRRLVC